MMLLSYQIQCGNLLWQNIRHIDCLFKSFLHFCLTFRRFPFNWHNPIGYIIALSIEYITVISATVIALGIVTPVIASCIMIIALAKEVKHSVKEIRKHVKSKKYRMNVTKLFPELIEFYSNAIRLSKFILKFKWKIQ